MHNSGGKSVTLTAWQPLFLKLDISLQLIVPHHYVGFLPIGAHQLRRPISSDGHLFSTSY